MGEIVLPTASDEADRLKRTKNTDNQSHYYSIYIVLDAKQFKSIQINIIWRYGL